MKELCSWWETGIMHDDNIVIGILEKYIIILYILK